MSDQPVMNNSDVENVPHALRTGKRFRNWKRLTSKTEPGKTVKFPVVPGFFELEKGDPRRSGHSLTSAVTWEMALKGLNATTGLGIVTGTIEGTTDYVVFDLDEKDDYSGVRWGDEPHHVGYETMRGLPIAMVVFAHGLMHAGGYAELSPSLKGVRGIIAGTLPEGHTTRWSFTADWLWGRVAQSKEEGELLAQGIGGEVYTTNRWLTLTGKQVHGADVDTSALAMTPGAATENFLSEFIAELLPKRAPKSSSATADVDATLSAQYIAPADLTGPLSVFRGEKLSALWAGELRGDDSRLDYRLCLTLFEVLGDDPVAVNAAFLSSGRHREKWATVHVKGATYGAATIANARAEWVEKGCKRFAQATPGEKPGTAIDWPAEAREAMLFGAVSQTKGTHASKSTVRKMMAAAFDMLDEGAYHVFEGRIYFHTGGLVKFAERTGGRSTEILMRGAWAAGAGFFSQFRQDAQGALQVVMMASHADCAVLREGVQPAFAVIPVLKRSAPRKARTQPAAPRVARAPISKAMQRAEWTMWLIMNGKSDVPTIAELSGQSVRAVKSHVADLTDAGMLTADMKPTLTHSAYRQAVQVERAACQRLTRERRIADTAEYRRRCALRGTKQPSAARLAEQAALDAQTDWYSNAAD